ncbi:MAG: tyrosine-protein kinase [Solirubrobacteraceae bacterium]|jgi:Mrp family chromosome partitioning ATPase/capsular polysaccharide biosynthesis protein|nr:tyrosine-protein kinase [Solirubrobacteraceae bacterium]
MPTQQPEVNARDFLAPLIRRRWLVLGFVVFVTVCTYAYYAHQPKVYEASTKILVAATGNPLDAAAAELSDRTISDQAGLLKSREVATAVARRLGRPGEAAALAGSISTAAAPGSDFVTIVARRPKAADAARVANAFAQAFVRLRSDAARLRVTKAISATRAQLNTLPHSVTNAAERASLADSIRQLQLTLSASSGSASQVDPAVPPSAQAGPHTLRNAGFAFVLSLIGAAALAFALEAFDRRPRRLDELSPLYGMPILAALPHVNAPVPTDEGEAAVAPEFKEPLRQLRTNIQLAALDQPFKSFLITSAVAGEGKSTIVRNLALVLREGGLSVVVVDADLRRPTLPRLFDQRPEPGLTDVLTGGASLDEALLKVPVKVRGLAALARMGEASSSSAKRVSSTIATSEAESISLLPPGPPPADPQAVLAAERTRLLLEGLAADYDILLIDSPPLLHVTDALTLASYADAVVVVARLGQVTRDNARRVADMLGRVVDAHPVGVVVNNAPIAEGLGYGYGPGY